MLSHERRAPVMVLQSRPSTANKCPTSSAACHTQGGNTSQATRTRHLHRSGSRIHACMALRPPRRPRSWQHHLRMMQLMAPSIAGASVGPPPTCSTCRAAPIALKYLGCTLRRRTAARARPSCKLQACTCASGTIGRASQVRSCAVCEWLGRGDIGSLPRSSGSVVRVRWQRTVVNEQPAAAVERAAGAHRSICRQRSARGLLVGNARSAPLESKALRTDPMASSADTSEKRFRDAASSFPQVGNSSGARRLLRRRRRRLSIGRLLIGNVVQCPDSIALTERGGIRGVLRSGSGSAVRGAGRQRHDV